VSLFGLGGLGDGDCFLFVGFLASLEMLVLFVMICCCISSSLLRMVDIGLSSSLLLESSVSIVFEVVGSSRKRAGLAVLLVRLREGRFSALGWLRPIVR